MPRLAAFVEVYREFVATNFAEAMTYRVHFVLVIVMELLFYVTTLGTIDLIYGQVDTIGVWNREQFLFFASYMLAVDQLHMTLVSGGFWILSENIRTGALDWDLLRPLPFWFTAFFRWVRPGSLVLLPVAWGLVIWTGLAAGLAWWAWLVLPFLLALSFTLLVAFEVLLATLMFVTVEGTGINFLRMQFQTLSRWPDFVFAPWPRRLFSFVLPVLLVGSAPVRILFDPADSLLLLGLFPLLGAILVLNGIAWRAALASYSSASS